MKYNYIYQNLAKCDLNKYYSMNKLTREEIDLWSDQMYKSICYLHQYNIIHGDIKSSNFLIRIYLSQFGGTSVILIIFLPLFATST